MMNKAIVLGAAISLGLGIFPSSAMAASIGQVAAVPNAVGNTTIQESNSPTATSTFFSETNPGRHCAYPCNEISTWAKRVKHCRPRRDSDIHESYSLIFSAQWRHRSATTHQLTTI